MEIWADLRKLLAGLWLGAAIFFSAAVAQSAFAVLPSAELAGAVVNRTLSFVNYSGIVIGILLLLSSLVLTPRVFVIWIERLFALLLTVACAVGQFYVGWKMQSLRAQMGRPLEEVAADDPLRIAFNQLHGYSVWVLLTAMVSALILFFIVNARNQKEIVQTKTDDFKF
jgi:hypothetical protein